MAWHLIIRPVGAVCVRPGTNCSAPSTAFVVERVTAIKNDNEQFFFFDGTSQRQSMVKSWARNETANVSEAVSVASRDGRRRRCEHLDAALTYVERVDCFTTRGTGAAPRPIGPLRQILHYLHNGQQPVGAIFVAAAAAVSNNATSAAARTGTSTASQERQLRRIRVCRRHLPKVRRTRRSLSRLLTSAQFTAHDEGAAQSTCLPSLRLSASRGA
jgi:hypothetical protein